MPRLYHNQLKKKKRKKEKKERKAHDNLQTEATK